MAARARPQPVGVVRLPEEPAQARDMEAKRLEGFVGRTAAPQAVDENVVGQQALWIDFDRSATPRRAGPPPSRPRGLRPLT